jgi:hypothetical protein
MPQTQRRLPSSRPSSLASAAERARRQIVRGAIRANPVGAATGTPRAASGTQGLTLTASDVSSSLALRLQLLRREVERKRRAHSLLTPRGGVVSHQKKAMKDRVKGCHESALGRREFLKRLGVLGAGAAATNFMFNGVAGCSGGGVPEWPISRDVLTTAQQQIFPVGLSSDAPLLNPADVPLYEQYGYSAWRVGPGLPYVKRTELAPGYDGAPGVARLLSFFSITDIHISDKESPAQPIYIGWSALYGPSSAYLSSAYSATMLSTTHVLDSAIQTINALHRRSPFDFGISLGDDTNNSQYNELRWFIDVLDPTFRTSWT